MMDFDYIAVSHALTYLNFVFLFIALWQIGTLKGEIDEGE